MEEATKLLEKCRVCPRECGVNRLAGQKGACRAGLLPKIALVSLHKWEEPCISGEAGSGTVFFAHCNLRCVFCQNHTISQEDCGKEASIEHLAEIFLKQQRLGAHNVNLVSPTQFMPQIRDALVIAKEKGLGIPVIYNSNAYESAETLKEMDGLVDVYLPDLKYYDGNLALKYSGAPDYFRYATEAIMEMYRQVGVPEFDGNGLIKRGLLIRHLVLPGHAGDSKKVLKWMRDNLPTGVYISLMAQYTPMYKAEKYKELSGRVTAQEYEHLTDYFFEIGLENGYVQEHSSATEIYTPDFKTDMDI